MKKTELLKKIEDFLTKKILPYYNIITDVSDIVKNKEESSQAELIKNILLDLIINEYYKKSFTDTEELEFYSGKLNIDLSDDKVKGIIHKALIKRLESYGLPLELLSKFNTSELLKIYTNYHFIDKVKSTIQQIQRLLNLFNVRLVSIAELYIQEKNNDIVFIPRWIYHDEYISETQLPKQFTYDEIYNSTPGFLISKEDIIANKDKIIFPLKTNILLIYYNTVNELNLLTYLKAAYIFYLLNNYVLDIDLVTIESNQLIDANDIIYIMYYLNLLNIVNNSIDNIDTTPEQMITKPIFNLPNIVEYIQTNEQEFLNMIQTIDTFGQFENSSNELYEQRKEIISWIKNFLMIEDDVFIDSRPEKTLKILDELISSQYPLLYQDIQNIYQYKNTNEEKFNLLYEKLVSELIDKLLDKIIEAINNSGKRIDIDFTLSYLFILARVIDVTNNNEIEQLYSKYILLIKYLQPAYILYAEPKNYLTNYYISDRILNGLYIYSNEPYFKNEANKYSFYQITENKIPIINYEKYIEPDKIKYKYTSFNRITVNYRYKLDFKSELYNQIYALSNYTFYLNISQQIKFDTFHNIDETITIPNFDFISNTEFIKSHIEDINKLYKFTVSTQYFKSDLYSFNRNISESMDNVVVVYDYYSVPLFDYIEIIPG